MVCKPTNNKLTAQPDIDGSCRFVWMSIHSVAHLSSCIFELLLRSLVIALQSVSYPEALTVFVNSKQTLTFAEINDSPLCMQAGLCFINSMHSLHMACAWSACDDTACRLKNRSFQQFKQCRQVYTFNKVWYMIHSGSQKYL